MTKFLVIFGSNHLFNSIKFRISNDRNNVCFGNFILRKCRTTVAEENCTGNFLIKHHSHFTLKPSDNIQTGNIDNVVTIHFLFLINGCRVNSSLKKSKHFFFLKLAFHITFSSCLVFTQISKDHLDTAERRMMYSVHNGVYPSVGLSFNKLRCFTVYRLMLGEEHVNLIHTVFYCMRKEAFLKTSITLTITDNLSNGRMTKSILVILLTILIE